LRSWPQWVEGGGVGRRLERPLDAADGENAVDRLRARDADDAALISTRTSRADELIQPRGVHEAQPSQVYDRKCWAFALGREQRILRAATYLAASVRAWTLPRPA
jgi:hypothetical protein